MKKRIQIVIAFVVAIASYYLFNNFINRKGNGFAVQTENSTPVQTLQMSSTQPLHSAKPNAILVEKKEPEQTSNSGWSQFTPKKHASMQVKDMQDLKVYRKAKKAYLGKLPKQEIEMNGQKVWFLKNIYAKSLIKNKNKNLSSTLGDEDLLFLPERLGPYVFFQNPETNRDLLISGVAADQEYPVVITDLHNGRLGIVNGEIAFYKYPNGDFNYFIEKYKFTLLKTYHGSLTNRASFQVPAGSKIDQLVEELKVDAQVNHEFEIDVDISTDFAVGS